MTIMQQPSKKFKLGVANRDGEAYAVKTKDGRFFLVLEADTFHNSEVFLGMGSTEQVEISQLAFTALASGSINADLPP